MDIEFYVNPRTGEPHCLDHDVTEEAVVDVLDAPLERRPGNEGPMIASGQTREGRWLRVIYPERPTGIPVITAFPPGPKTIAGLRRRKRRKKR
ncbi:MAG: hypothetical protein M0R74_10235 [Dehalococcoidia bacterium]|nr:hypothetical protein [Dehalococcoidia bacterium]